MFGKFISNSSNVIILFNVDLLSTSLPPKHFLLFSRNLQMWKCWKIEVKSWKIVEETSFYDCVVFVFWYMTTKHTFTHFNITTFPMLTLHEWLLNMRLLLTQSTHAIWLYDPFWPAISSNPRRPPGRDLGICRPQRRWPVAGRAFCLSHT